MFSDVGTRKYHAAIAKPRTVTNTNGLLWHRLDRDRKRDIFVSVVLVGDVNVVTCPHIITNLNGKVPHDAAPLANEATIANGHNAF